MAGLALAWLLAAFPALHDRLHSDADGRGHECLATVLDHGLNASSGAPPAPVRTSLGCELWFRCLPDRSRAVQSLFLGARIFEHAPPVRS